MRIMLQTYTRKDKLLYLLDIISPLSSVVHEQELEEIDWLRLLTEFTTQPELYQVECNPDAGQYTVTYSDLFIRKPKI